MNYLTKYLLKRTLRRVLARVCGPRIPRSGHEGEAVNCFVVSIDRNRGPYLVALSIDGDELSCINWNGSRFETEEKLFLETIDLCELVISHCYGLSTIRYSGLFDFVLNRFLGWPYAKIRWVRLFSRFDQYLFNKRKLVTRQRTDLLKVILARQLEERRPFSSLDLMTDLYSMKWVLHPQGDEQQGKVEVFLDALVDTGELKEAGHQYQMKCLTLKAIEEYEEQERKHTENVKLQWRMLWLTVALLALTILQAGIVKLPVLIDLSGSEIQ